MGKIAVLFPGQSSQYIGMGKAIYENYELVREIYNKASECLGYDLYDLIDSGDMKELMKAPKLQPAILVTTYSFFMLTKEILGIQPDFMAGHSLGEISALVCGGVLEFEDAVKIAQSRGKFMQEVSDEIGEGAMVAISEIELENIKQLCKDYQDRNTPVYLSNYNSTDQYVVSGLKSDIMSFGEDIKQMGGTAIAIRVNLPFHSPYMKHAADKFEEELRKYKFKPADCNIISNVTGEPYPVDADIPAILTRQIVSPVRWIDSMKYLEAAGVELLLEMGPGRVLSNMVQNISERFIVNFMDNPKDGKYSLDIFEDKKLFNRNYLIERMLGTAVSVQNHNFDEDSYRTGVVNPYNKLREISDELEATGKRATDKVVKECADFLKGILECKGTDKEDINSYLGDLMKETMLII